MKMFGDPSPSPDYSDSNFEIETENKRLTRQVAKLLRHTGNLENKILALKGDKEMKFEVGKKYKARDENIKFVRVDCIRYEFLNSNYRAMSATIFWISGEISTCDLFATGTFNKSGESEIDLICPYEEPSLLITAEDVGRKVKLKDGSIHIICGFIFAECESDTSCRFVINGCGYNASGASLMTYLSTDVVEFV